MRIDGRRDDQLRPLKITTGYMPTAAGSVLIECGDTRVICTATVEEKTASFLTGTGKGWLTAEYSMLPGSTPTRKQRERGKMDSRSTEIQRLIGRSLRSAVNMDKLGERTIWIDCDCIGADGGTRTASITGGFIALRLACDKLVAEGILDESPIITSIAAVSVGISGSRAMLDLNYAEDSAAEVDMNVVMKDEGSYIEIQGTGEGRAYTRDEADTLLDLAEKGIRELLYAQQQAIGGGSF